MNTRLPRRLAAVTLSLAVPLNTMNTAQAASPAQGSEASRQTQTEESTTRQGGTNFLPSIPSNSDIVNSYQGDRSVTVESLSGDPLHNGTDTPSGKQFEWQVDDNESDHSKRFRVKSSGHVDLSLDAPSGAIIVKVNDTPRALIDAPWAKDRNGNEVQTHFDVNGDTFTQKVEQIEDTGAYPITADPRVNWGIVSGHIYFSKDETRKVAASTAAAFAITPFWVLVPPPFGESLGIWWGVHAAEVTVWASAAIAQDKCLSLKVGATQSLTPPSVGVSPEHYTDGCV